jgi:hypothetical protein
MIAALFVESAGVYANLLGVELWDKERDARRYNGPHAVVAHPPCERWGRYWGGGPSAKTPRALGDDAGCFASALASVRRVGGVLEHPEGSHAFAHYELGRPEWRAGWSESADGIGHVCCVAQRHYGHRARKLTWLYTVRCILPVLDWSIPAPGARLDLGYHSAEERKAESRPKSNSGRLSTRENLATPLAFRDVLIAMAGSVR